MIKSVISGTFYKIKDKMFRRPISCLTVSNYAFYTKKTPKKRTK